MTMPNQTRDMSRSKIAQDWWRKLQPLVTESGGKLPGDRATLARLRRAANLYDAAAEPETIRLFRLLGFSNPDRLGRVAVVAAVLAHVREQPKNRERLARALGPPRGGKPEDAVYSTLRLRRLLATRGDDDLLIAFRRAVAILKDTANVGDLATLILDWDDDERGDITRTRFAFDYHDAGEHAPSSGTGIAPTSTLEKA